MNCSMARILGLLIASVITVSAQIAPADTINHVYIAVGGLSSISAPLTLRSNINATGAGAGVTYVKDFNPQFSSDLCAMYSIAGRGLVRLSMAVDRLSGSSNALLISDTQFKPTAEASFSNSFSSKVLLLGFEREVFNVNGINAFWGGHVGAFIAGDDRITSVDYTSVASQVAVKGEIREGMNRSLAPAMAASFGLRYNLPSGFGLEIRGQYSMIFSTTYTTKLTLSETLNNVTTVIGERTSSRSIDGMRFGLYMSYELW